MPAHEGKQELRYYVQIDAQVVPFFVVDLKGNPVYNISEEEIELLVNGKSIKALDFKHFQFDTPTAVPKEKEPIRIIFIIIDTVFTGKVGIHRAKNIASELVKKANSDDRFIVLLNTPGGGLKYLIGPEKDAGILQMKIKSISEIPLSRHRKKSFSAEQPIGEKYRQIEKRSTMMQNQADVQRFAYILEQFKYALKTINLPKVVFLISEGFSNESFREDLEKECQGDAVGCSSKDGLRKTTVFKTYLFDYFKKIAKSINYGGSVLYSIDPAPSRDYDDTDISGDMSLMLMASESGGQYFKGRDTNKVVQLIKKTTSAYYELYFTPDKETLEKMKIQIKCKRDGVRVHSIYHTEKDKSYKSMETVQKKIFALNVVTGGEWSRMVGKVVKVKYKKTEEEKNVDTVTLRMPDKMKDQKVDVFVFNIEPKTQKVNVSFASVVAGDPLKLNIKRVKGKHRYFAVIEPINTYCVYNKVD